MVCVEIEGEGVEWRRINISFFGEIITITIRITITIAKSVYVKNQIAKKLLTRGYEIYRSIFLLSYVHFIDFSRL